MHRKTIKVFINNNASVYSVDEFNESFKDFKVIEAAGGLVFNAEQHLLIIHRLGYWDLPKGKIDKGETPKQAALREVEEECGIGKLKIYKEVETTYHTYNLNGKDILKKTYWFLMTTEDDSELIPQTDEHIEQAIWANKDSLRKLNEQDAYALILDLIHSSMDL